MVIQQTLDGNYRESLTLKIVLYYCGQFLFLENFFCFLNVVIDDFRDFITVHINQLQTFDISFHSVNSLNSIFLHFLSLRYMNYFKIYFWPYEKFSFYQNSFISHNFFSKNMKKASYESGKLKIKKIAYLFSVMFSICLFACTIHANTQNVFSFTIFLI